MKTDVNRKFPDNVSGNFPHFQEKSVIVALNRFYMSRQRSESQISLMIGVQREKHDWSDYFFRYYRGKKAG